MIVYIMQLIEDMKQLKIKIILKHVVLDLLVKNMLMGLQYQIVFI